MVEFNDSLTEIDWLQSLQIKAPKPEKDENSFSINETEPNCDFNVEDAVAVKTCGGYEKPSYSYAYLIKLAIESSGSKQLKLNEIYSWITQKFPYYGQIPSCNNKGWKNAIRHNLSLNKTFKRCPKDKTHRGKGSYWTIDPNCDDSIIQCPPVKKLKLIKPLNTRKSLSINESISEYSSSPSNTTTTNLIQISSSPSAGGLPQQQHSQVDQLQHLQQPIHQIQFDQQQQQQLQQLQQTHNQIHTTSTTLSNDNYQSIYPQIYTHLTCPPSASSMSTYSINNESINIISLMLSNSINRCALPSTINNNNNNNDNNNQSAKANEFLCSSSSTHEDLYNTSNKSIGDFSGKPSTPITDSCEYSYFQDLLLKPIRNQLEVEDYGEDKTNSCNQTLNNILLRTPVLSQITSVELDNDPLKDPEFSNHQKFNSNENQNHNNEMLDNSHINLTTSSNNNSIHNNNINQLNENFNFQDSLTSLNQNLFDSETFSRMTSYLPSQQNNAEDNSNSSDSPKLLSAKNSFTIPCESIHKRISQESFFDGSFGLSVSTKNFLLDLSGVKENLHINSNSWSDLNIPRSNNVPNNVEEDPLKSTENNKTQSNITKKSQNASKDFLEMKNSLRQYRYRTSNSHHSNNCSSTHFINQHNYRCVDNTPSVSTPSTEKSTGTVYGDDSANNNAHQPTSNTSANQNPANTSTSCTNCVDLDLTSHRFLQLKSNDSDDGIINDPPEFNWESII